MRSGRTRRQFVAIGLVAAALATALWLTRDRPAAVAPARPPTARLAPATVAPAAARSVPVVGEAVAGRLVDHDGHAVAGASVTLLAEPGDGDVLAVVTTGPTGEFVASGLPRGSYLVRVEGAGVASSELRNVAAPASALMVVVTRRVTVAGRVVDGAAPAAGTVVELESAAHGTLAEVVAGADGRFSAGELPEGTYEVFARRGRRAARVLGVARFGAGPWPELVIELGPAATLVGQVRDSAGGAVAGAWVLVGAEDEASAPRRARTDDDGRYALDGLVPGSFGVEVVADGFLAPMLEPLLAAADTRLALDVVLERGATLAGQVVDLRGAPVAGARIELVEAGGAATSRRIDSLGRGRRRARAEGKVAARGARLIPVGELGVLPGPIPYPPPVGAFAAAVRDVAAAGGGPVGADPFTTGADGRFRIDAVPAGRWIAQATHADFAPGRGAPVAVGVGGGVGGHAEVTLRRGARVVGTVVDGESGESVAGCRLVARAGKEIVATVDCASGRYALTQVDGDVALVASAPGYEERTLAVAVGEDDEGRELTRPITLAAASAALAGVVLDPSGAPVGGAEVVAERAGAKSSSTRSAEDGRFRIAGVGAGTWRVFARHAAYAPSPAIVVELGSARRGDELRLLLAWGGGVTGTVRDRQTYSRLSGVRIGGERVGGGGAVARSVDDGAFSLVGLEPGAWRFTFTASGYAPGLLEREVPAGREAAAVTVRDVIVELVLGGVLEGVVIDAHGERLAGARVECGGVATTSDVDGRFRLDGVPPGEVIVRARHAQGGAGAITVPLRSGGAAVRLELRTEPDE